MSTNPALKLPLPAPEPAKKKSSRGGWMILQERMRSYQQERAKFETALCQMDFLLQARRAQRSSG